MSITPADYSHGDQCPQHVVKYAFCSSETAGGVHDAGYAAACEPLVLSGSTVNRSYSKLHVLSAVAMLAVACTPPGTRLHAYGYNWSLRQAERHPMWSEHVSHISIYLQMLKENKHL